MRNSFSRATRPRALSRTPSPTANIAMKPRASPSATSVVAASIHAASGGAPDSAPTKSGRPTRRMFPSTTPSTPWPATTWRCSARGRSNPVAAARNTCASGCSDVASSAAASAITSSRVPPRCGCTSTSDPHPGVNVPVLSKTTCVTCASDSSASPRVTITCRRASAPVAAASAAGVASDSAHGQETTSTAKVTASARDGSCSHQTTAVSAASARSAPTNQAADRSATRAIRGRSEAARATRRSIAARRVASPAAMTRTTIASSRTMLPASTGSPTALRIGRDSPVRIASSTFAHPSATAPSAGTVAPARTSTKSPAPSSAAATARHSCRAGQSTSCSAVAGRARATASTASPARRRAMSST